MSTLKVNTINAATSGQAVAVDISNPRSFRNLIINGAMQVAQRGTSASTTGISTVDRFKLGASGRDEAQTQSQHVLTSSDTGPWEKGFRYSYHLQNGNQTGGLDAGDHTEIKYTIEAQDIAQSGWDYTSSSSYITLSFWVKSSVAQNFHGYIKTQDGTFKRNVFETGSLTADTWTKITKTFSGHSDITFNNDTGEGLILELLYYAGTDETGTVTLDTWATFNGSIRTPNATNTWWTTNDATFEITGVQLEVGSYATDFEHRSYGDELARCQRYCVDFPINSQLGLGQVYSGSGWVQLPVAVPVPMRAKPSVSKNGDYWFNSNIGNSGYSGDRTVTVEQPGTGGAHMYRLFVQAGSNQNDEETVWCQIHDAAGTYMRLEAEL